MTLEGKVALVAGATRGAGRGIATALGEKGATVYCTGRTTREARSPMNRPETIEETAERVTKAGGRGVAVRVDHAREDEVASLVARIERDEGRLDLLVNDVWGGDALTEWETPFWKLDVAKGRAMMESALWTHVLTARAAAPLLLRRPGGLVIEVTDGVSPRYRGSLFYDLAKSSVIRLAFAMSHELRPHGVAALAVTPGFLRSEAVLDVFGVTEGSWREGAKKDPHFAYSETPLFVGRAVASLAGDPDIMQKSGGAFASWDLAKEYGFADADGAQPDWGAHWKEAFGED